MNQIPKSTRQLESIASKVTLVIAVLATTLILVLYMGDRSVFLDEANLIRNIYERSYSDLLNPLGYDQSAPFLYLWLAKLSTSLGSTSILYRLPSLIFVVGSIWIFRRLARQLLQPVAAITAMAMYASHELVWRYATECKQYGADVSSAIMLSYLTTNYPPNSPLRIALWCVVGTLVQWLSMPAIIVLVGTTLYWLWRVQDGKLKLKPLLIIGFVWSMALLFNYIEVLHPGMNSSHMQAYHEEYFFSLSGWESTRRSVLSYVRLLDKKTAVGMVTVSVMLLVGVYKGLRDRPSIALLLLSPILASMVLSALGMYSLIERLLLFLLPLLILLVGAGLDRLVAIESPRLRAILLTLAVIGLMVAIQNRAGLRMLSEHPSDDLLTSMQVVDQDGGKYPAYISKLAYPTFYYYTNIHRKLTKRAIVVGVADHGLVQEIDQLMKADTCWIILSHVDNLPAEANQLADRYEILTETKSSGTHCLLVVR